MGEVESSQPFPHAPSSALPELGASTLRTDFVRSPPRGLRFLQDSLPTGRSTDQPETISRWNAFPNNTINQSVAPRLQKSQAFSLPPRNWSLTRGKQFPWVCCSEEGNCLGVREIASLLAMTMYPRVGECLHLTGNDSGTQGTSPGEAIQRSAWSHTTEIAEHCSVVAIALLKSFVGRE